MSDVIKRVDAYLDAHLDESVAELSRLCAQPSVSAQNWGLEPVSYTHLTLPTIYSV